MPITNSAIYNAIQALEIRLQSAVNQILGAIAMSESQTQTDIDNATSILTGLLNDVSGDDSTILADLVLIKQQAANGQPVDTTKLDAAIATVQGIQTGLDTAVTSLTGQANPPAATTPPSGTTAPVTPPTTSPPTS